MTHLLNNRFTIIETSQKYLILFHNGSYRNHVASGLVTGLLTKLTTVRNIQLK